MDFCELTIDGQQPMSTDQVRPTDNTLWPQHRARVATAAVAGASTRYWLTYTLSETRLYVTYGLHEEPLAGVQLHICQLPHLCFNSSTSTTFAPIRLLKEACPLTVSVQLVSEVIQSKIEASIDCTAVTAATAAPGVHGCNKEWKLCRNPLEQLLRLPIA